MKKRIFAFIFAVTLMATSVFPAMALDANSLPSDRATLSGLSTDEQLYFLQAQGIEVPHSYSEYITSLITHVRRIRIILSQSTIRNIRDCNESKECG